MKKFLSLLLCAMMIMALVPAAVAEGDNYVHVIGRNLGNAIDGDNAILKEIEKRTGLDIEWELWPTDGYAQQCQLLFASGEYPDIDFDATVEKYIKEWNEAGGAEWTKEINEYWASRK